MDFSKEFTVKTEIDDSDMDFHVEIDVTGKDWCKNHEDIGIPDQNKVEDVEIEYDEQLDIDDIQKCLRCNELFIDSGSLLRHNLTHLFLTLERLPDELFDFYESPAVPLKETNGLIIGAKLDMPDTCDKSYDTLIKCEVIESDSESVDKIPNTEECKKDISLEDNNNDVPITKRDHKCDICFKVFNYKHWHAHMNEVHSKIMIKCKLCKKEYKSNKSLRKHACSAKIRHIEIGTWKCDHCNSVFNSKDCMQKHVKNVHSQPVNCEICNSLLGSEVYLAAHMRRVHYDDGKVHSCDICGKIFKSPRYVKVHMKNSHSKKKIKNNSEEIGLVYAIK